MHHRSYIGKDFFAKGERTRAANTCLASSLPRAQRRFPSPSPSPKEERAGERRPFSISFPSLQLSPPEPRETSNVQHRTTNVEVNEDSRCHSMFGAGCSMSDVPPSSWGGNTSKTRAGIEAMNQIGTPLPALSPHGGERVAEGRAFAAPKRLRPRRRERGGSWKGGMPGLLRDVRENQRALTHLQHAGQGRVAAG